MTALAALLGLSASPIFCAQAVPASSDAPKAANAAAPAPHLTPEQARQARLIADTAKLYQLAQELKAEVDKSSKDTLSIAVLKKAAEVEQLARDLKERMKAEGSKPK